MVRTEYDVVVIGAGAAGLLAAARSAETGLRTLLLEKNARAGTKILMSGGTRCNITQSTDRRGIVAAFGKPGRFLHSALAAFGPDDVVDMFHAEFVPTKVEPGGKVFPVSNKAADVLRALLGRLTRSGCQLALNEPALDIDRATDQYCIRTTRRQVTTNRLVVTTGGKSYPGSGTTGDGYEWMTKLGHTVIEPRPALTPITSDATWLRELKGITVPDAQLRVLEGKRQLNQSRGSLLFTHFGLSGPTALNVSRSISVHPNPRSLSLRLDLVPEVDESQLREMMKQLAQQAGKSAVSKLIPASLQKRLGWSLLTLAEVSREARIAATSRAERARITEQLKETIIPISGTRGFKKAEVTTGGISLDEIDSRTMESRLAPGLFIAGELLDLDGPIGGYNFQAAFSTGWLAGNCGRGRTST